MASIFINDPDWDAFVKSQGAAPTAPTYQGAMTGGVPDYQSPDWANWDATLGKYRQQSQDYQQNLRKLFKQKYGRDPTMGISGPPMKPTSGTPGLTPTQTPSPVIGGGGLSQPP